MCKKQHLQCATGSAAVTASDKISERMAACMQIVVNDTPIVNFSFSTQCLCIVCVVVSFDSGVCARLKCGCCVLLYFWLCIL